jgi:hypothetical protein
MNVLLACLGRSLRAFIHWYRGTGDDAFVLDAREPKQSEFPQSYQELRSPLEIAAEIGNYLT